MSNSGGDGVLWVQKRSTSHQAFLAGAKGVYFRGTVDADQVYVGTVSGESDVRGYGAEMERSVRKGIHQLVASTDTVV